MIDPKELRIGTLVKQLGVERIGGPSIPEKDQIVTVTSLLSEQFRRINGINEGYFEPIPLTEEWLTKRFRFKKLTVEGLVYYQYKNFKVFIMASSQDVMKDIFVPGYYIHAFDTIELKYAHKMQNLFFELEGEELTIK